MLPIRRLAALSTPILFSALSPVLGQGFCVKSDDSPGTARRITASADRLTFCLGDEPCGAVEFSSGKYSMVKMPKERPSENVTDGGQTRVDFKGKTARICREKRCATITTDVMPEQAEAFSLSRSVRYISFNYWVIVNESHVYVTDIFDFSSRKRVARHKFGNEIGECVIAQFLGESLMVTRNNCAGPSDKSDLVEPETGRVIASVGNGLSTAGVTPVHTGGDVWAFQNFEGDQVVIQDVKTGRILKDVNVAAALPKKEDGTPLLDVGSTVLAGGAGKLFVIYSGSLAGVVVMLDQTGRILKTFRPDNCGSK